MQIVMSRGRLSLRGYFPVGGELTSGGPERQEGLYFGAELPGEQPAVLTGNSSRFEPVPRDSRPSRGRAALHRLF